MRSLSLALTMMLAAACGDDDNQVFDAAPQPDAPQAADAGPDAFVPPSDAGTAILPEDLPSPLPTGAPNVTVTTYNVGLLATIKGAPQRLPFLITAIKAEPADVLCLNEVWDEFSNPSAMAAALADTYPYSWWSWEGVTGYGNGVLIVSKHPLYRGRSLLFANADPNGVVDRMVLGVDVVTPDAYFHVMCSHLTAFSNPGNVANRQAQIAEAKAFAMANGYWDEPTFWLGDLNTGPSTGNCTSMQPEPPPEPPCTTCVTFDEATYTTHLLTDWQDPHAAATFCTYCWDIAIPLQFLPLSCAEIEFDQRIDHCLTRNIDVGTLDVAQSGIVFDEPQSIMTPGGDTLVNLSDHLGVRCVFSAP